MSSNQIDELLESVEQLIGDENKIVTYEFLSQTCGTHVNLAKTVLERYAENYKKSHPSSPLEVVYNVGGYSGKNLKLMLVTESKLQDALSKLDKVLFSHVYSVQKGKLESFGLLYNSNLTELTKSIQQCTGQSAINFTLVRPKTGEELNRGRLVIEPAVSSIPAKVAGSRPESRESPTTKTEPAEKAKETGSAPKVNEAKKAAGKPSAISAFFSKQQAKEPSEKPASAMKTEETVKKPLEVKTSATNNKRVVRELSDGEEEEKDTNDDKKRFKLSEDEKPQVEAAAKSKKKTTAASKAKENKKAGSKPQRKRIQQFSDSESSDQDSDADVLMSSPELGLKPAARLEDDDEDFLNATVVDTSSQPKRARKMVTEHYEDKDGFIVTRKVFKTCDVDEDDGKQTETAQPIPSAAKAPAAVKIEPAKRPSPPGKSKQKSIMSFFGKK